MTDVDLEQAADVLNDYKEEASIDGKNRKPYRVNNEHYIERDGTASLGAGEAQALLEAMGVIVVKTLYLEDRNTTRIWLRHIESEEVEVTKTETRYTING